MSKDTSGTGKQKPAKPKKRDYRLQILFDQEERAMLEDLAADRRLAAGVLVRQLILEEYRRRKG